MRQVWTAEPALQRLPFNLRFQESGIARRRRQGKVSSTAPIGLGASTITVAEDAPAQSHSVPEQAFTTHNSSTNRRSATAHARKGSSGERCGMRKNPHTG